MTKEELKDLVASKIEGQGNQVDLGNALETILNELIDLAPERKPITIDLSGFELSENDTDVTSAIPSGYVPQEGDKILYNQSEYGMEGFLKMEEGDIRATFGYGNTVIDSASIIFLTCDGDEWVARIHDR